MDWVTIYDIRQGWSLWIEAAISIFIVCFGTLMVVGAIGLSRSRSGQLTIKKRMPDIIRMFVATILAFLAASWWLYDDYRDRSDFASGHYLEAQGHVEGTHFEREGRFRPLYFRVGERWYKLPYSDPPSGYLRDGEPVKLDFPVTPDLMHSGPLAYAVFRLQLKRECRTEKLRR